MRLKIKDLELKGECLRVEFHQLLDKWEMSENWREITYLIKSTKVYIRSQSMYQCEFNFL